MKTSSSNNSWRNFPADLFVVSGIPLLGTILITSELFSLAGGQPRFFVIGALLVATLGACLLFWAKLPLYRKGIYCSFGPSAMPESRQGFYYWGIGLALSGCLLAGILIPLCGTK